MSFACYSFWITKTCIRDLRALPYIIDGRTGHNVLQILVDWNEWMRPALLIFIGDLMYALCLSKKLQKH